jgi:baseplate J-like protein
MAAIVYVDNDDEITSAAARIRATVAGPVALVVPSGSRLSTSRINFRLLARDAQARGRPLAIVAGDGSTRALAASAGLPVFGSVSEFEESVGSDGSLSPVSPAAPPIAATEPSARAESPPPPERTFGGYRAWPAPAIALPALPGLRLPAGRPAAITVVAVIALALVVLAVGAFLLLPSATITVTPSEEPLGPLALSIRADTAATSSDPVAGVVPAQRLSFDLAAGDTFAVKGRRVVETKASGRVTFRSKDPTQENRIAAGSVVSTSAGVRFRTTATIVIPRATFVGFTVIPGTASVGVEAVKPGPQGNVDANSITVVPQNEDPNLTDVRNHNATSGGTHEEFPRIDKADIDAAVGQLTKQLGQDFESMLAEPGRVPPALTAFAETRSLSDPIPTTDPATLIGKGVETFELELRSTGSVTAVDQSLVTTLATDRIRAAVSADHAVVDGSLQADVGGPSVEGESVLFPVTARAVQVMVLDAPRLIGMIKGKPIPQARAALAPFGDVRVTVWPDWVSSIPTIDARIDLKVVAPSPTQAP